MIALIAVARRRGGGEGKWRKVGQHLEMCIDCPKAISWSVTVFRTATIPNHAYSSAAFSYSLDAKFEGFTPSSIGKWCQAFLTGLVIPFYVIT
jgi:hypothetical protein